MSIIRDAVSTKTLPFVLSVKLESEGDADVLQDKAQELRLLNRRFNNVVVLILVVTRTDKNKLHAEGISSGIVRAYTRGVNEGNFFLENQNPAPGWYEALTLDAKHATPYPSLLLSMQLFVEYPSHPCLVIYRWQFEGESGGIRTLEGLVRYCRRNNQQLWSEAEGNLLLLELGDMIEIKFDRAVEGWTRYRFIMW